MVDILLEITTDGDFEFNNSDHYFKEGIVNTQGYEEIGYISQSFIEEWELRSSLIDIFREVNNRVFNRYNQKDFLIKRIKRITPFKTDFGNIDPITLFNINGMFKYNYLGGNQDMVLTICK